MSDMTGRKEKRKPMPKRTESIWEPQVIELPLSDVRTNRVFDEATQELDKERTRTAGPRRMETVAVGRGRIQRRPTKSLSKK